MIEFLMPSLGADMEAGTLVEWRKKPGDRLGSGDIIAEVDTQKGLIEIEVFESGILENYLIEEGDKVPVGTPMATIKIEESEGLTAGKNLENEPEIHPIQEKKEIEETKRSLPQKETLPGEGTEKKPPETKPRIKASPLARSIAQANQMDLSLIMGTGEGGAITKADVEKALSLKKESPQGKVEEHAPKPPEKPQVRPESAAGVKAPPQEAIRAAVGAAMSLSNREIPQYYLEKRIDMQAALIWLKATNDQRDISKRLLPAVLFIKAVAKAVDTNPALNAVWYNGLQIKNEINIGFVVSLRAGGILVPAIKNADTKSLEEIMDALNDIIPRARALKLRSSELSDSTITITSLGENGADKVFGVIYPPQVAIIGFGSIVTEAVVHHGMMAIRPVVYVTLAGDHRATDGVTGSRFLETLNNNLQNPNAL